MLSASSAPLKLTSKDYNYMISFKNLHYMNNRATANQITLYKHALLLHKLYNCNTTSYDWLSLFFNQQFNSRQEYAHFVNTSRFKIGNNLLQNRFNVLNGKINLKWLKLSARNYS